MKKSYADTCIERAEKAFYKPAKSTHRPIQDTCPECKCPSRFDGLCCNNFCELYRPEVPDRTQESISRQDVPELARRLKRACELLMRIARLNDDLHCYQMAMELERMPEEGEE